MSELIKLTKPMADPDKWKAYVLFTDIIAGARHYEAGKPGFELNRGDLLTLVYEPTNNYDPTAIAIYKGEAKLGYIFKNTKVWFGPLLLSGFPHVVELLSFVNEGLPNVEIYYRVYLLSEYSTELVGQSIVQLSKLQPYDWDIEPGTPVIDFANLDLTFRLQDTRYDDELLDRLKDVEAKLARLHVLNLPLIHVSNKPKFHFGHFKTADRYPLAAMGLVKEIVSHTNKCCMLFFKDGTTSMYKLFDESVPLLKQYLRLFGGDDPDHFRRVLLDDLCEELGKSEVNTLTFTTRLFFPLFGEARFMFNPVVINELMRFDLFDFDCREEDWYELLPIAYDYNGKGFGRVDWMYLRILPPLEVEYNPFETNRSLHESLVFFEAGELSMFDIAMQHPSVCHYIVKLSVLFALLKELFTPLELKLYFGDNVTYHLSYQQYSTHNGMIDPGQFRLINR